MTEGASEKPEEIQEVTLWISGKSKPYTGITRGKALGCKYAAYVRNREKAIG